MKLTKEYVGEDIGKGVVASKEDGTTSVEYIAKATADAYIDNATFEAVQYWAVVRAADGSINDAEDITAYVKKDTAEGFDLCTNCADYTNNIPVLAARSRKNQEIAVILDAARTHTGHAADIECAEVVLANGDPTDTTKKIIAKAYFDTDKYLNW